MNRNIEIKARVDNLAELRQRLLQLPIRATEQLDQTDTFFFVPRGRLKLREFADAPAELIFYERPDERGAKLSRYDRLPCLQPESMKRALGAALGVRGLVRKHREVYLVGQTRIHLDMVEGLGTFLELEVVLADAEATVTGEAVAGELFEALHVSSSNLLSGAYIDLLESVST